MITDNIPLLCSFVNHITGNYPQRKSLHNLIKEHWEIQFRVVMSVWVGLVENMANNSNSMETKNIHFLFYSNYRGRTKLINSMGNWWAKGNRWEWMRCLFALNLSSREVWRSYTLVLLILCTSSYCRVGIQKGVDLNAFKFRLNIFLRWMKFSNVFTLNFCLKYILSILLRKKQEALYFYN